MSDFYYKTNRLQQLRGLYYTIQFGKMSAAAKHMGLKQSAISMQIKGLEEELQIKLFNRKGPKISPTFEGKVFYKLISPHVEAIENIYERFAISLEESSEKDLTLAADYSTMTYFLPQPITNITKTYSKTDITVKRHTFDDAMSQLLQGEIHAYVGVLGTASDEFDVVPFAVHNAVCLVRDDHPLTKKKNLSLEDVKKYSLIHIDRDLASLPMLDNVIEFYKMDIAMTLECSDFETLKSYIRGSDNQTILSSVCTRQNMEGLTTIPLTQYFPDVQYGIVTKKGRYIAPPLNALIQSMKED